MSVIDYVGRKVDVAAFQGFSGSNEVLLRQTLADEGKSGQVLTGIVKLGQRFLLELFTELGSIAYAGNRGSRFMTDARLGLIRTQVDLITSFNRALLDVKRSLESEESDDDSPDERFRSAELTSISFTPGFAEITIQLASQDPSVQIILPVPMVF